MKLNESDSSEHHFDYIKNKMSVGQIKTGSLEKRSFVFSLPSQLFTL